MLAIMVISLIFVSQDQASFVEKVGQMFGIWIPRMSGLEGIWGLGSWEAVYRVPVLVLFLMLSLTLALSARAEKSRHLDELFGSGDGGDAILARVWRRDDDGLVPPADLVDHLPSES